MTLLEMRGITRQFPGVLANDNVDFTLEEGEIHALIGENGAGKSTLMNILYGLVQPDYGMIRLRGKQVEINSPQQAIQLGIGMVHQHFQLVPSLTVAENVGLGYEPRRGIVVDQETRSARVAELSNQFGLKVDPETRVADLSVGVRQRVEILKLLYRDAELLILDEPTAVLTPQEVDTFFDVTRRLVADNRTAIFITHKLREVMAICDRATVMRQGKVIGTLDTKDTNPEEIAYMMVGRDVSPVSKSDNTATEEVMLDVSDISANGDNGLEVLHNISFQVYANEIVGLAGVEGNGQHELLEVLTGLRPAHAGNLRIQGVPCTQMNSRQRREIGYALIPEDRNEEGLSPELSIWENMIATSYYASPQSRIGILQTTKLKQNALELMQQFDVRAEKESNPVKTLSGGNAQKVVIARELSQHPKVLIAAQPTRGLDIGAAEFVHEQLVALRNQGMGILVLSADLDELLVVSDRILVIYEGEIIGEIQAQDATRNELGLMMTGQQPVNEHVS